MEIKHYIIVAVIIGLLIIIFIPMGGDSDYYNCGEDRECFSEYSGNCEKAKLEYEEQGVLTRMFVEGRDGPNCGLKMEITNEGKMEDMTCWIPYNVTDFDPVNMTDSCSGPLADTLNELGQQLREELEPLAATNEACIEGMVWEGNFSKFVINGVVTPTDGVSYCYTTYNFRLPNKFDGFNVQHYFNHTDEEIYPDYEHKDYGNLEEWCVFDETNMYSDVAVAKSRPFEFATIDGIDWCHIAFYYHFYGFPEVEAHLFLSNDETQIQLKTSKGTVVEKIVK